MKRSLTIVFCVLSCLLFAESPKHPEDLADWESSLPRRLIADKERENKEQIIQILVATGSGRVVENESILRLPIGATISDVAALWRKQKGGMLIGWVQGLVVAYRKEGDRIVSRKWSQRAVREIANTYVLQDGDALIGLVYFDY